MITEQYLRMKIGECDANIIGWQNRKEAYADVLKNMKAPEVVEAPPEVQKLFENGVTIQ